jgi:putative superfamily III holin-X
MTELGPNPPPGAAGSGARATIGDTLAIAIGELVRLILQHGRLAGAELAASGAGLGMAAGLTIGALMLAFIGAILVLAGAALALAIVMPIWLAFLCVGGATMLAAAVLLVLARARSRGCTLVPRRTLASLRRHLAELAEPFV